MNLKFRWLALLVVLFPLITSGAVITWDTGTFEASPANTDPISAGDDRIRELKENISARLATEIYFGDRFAGGDTGRSREGNARAYYDNTCPTALSNSATDRTGNANLGAADEGRLCVDTDDGTFYKWNGSAWVQAITSFTSAVSLTSPTMSGATLNGTSTIANIATGTNIIGTTNFITSPLFAGAAGADAFNPLLLKIRSIVTDNTIENDVGCTAGLVMSTIAIASQIFGVGAGEGCYKVDLDLSTRTAATSTVIVLASVAVEAVGAPCNAGTPPIDSAWAGVYLDSMATRVGPLILFDEVDAGEISRGFIFAILTNVTNADHDFALHFEQDDADCSHPVIADTYSGNFLTVIDLGPTS